MFAKKSFLIIVILNLFVFGVNTKFASPEFQFRQTNSAQLTDTLTWVTLQSANPPAARANHSMVQLPNGQILLFGGVDSNNNVLGDTWLYAPPQVGQSINEINLQQSIHIDKSNLNVLADWTPITPPESPSSRQGHTMVTLPDGRVLLYGGSDTQGAWFNDLYVFVGDQWSLINPANDPPSARANHNAWVRNDKLYVQGGFGPSLLEDFWRYDINTNQWEQLQSPPDFISPHAFPMINSDKVVFVDVHRFPDNAGKLFYYDMDQNLWGEQQLTNWPPVSRSFYNMVQDDDKAYMLGGATWDETLQKNIYSKEVWRFDYSSLSWLQENCMPHAVYDGGAVFNSLQQNIILWGGRLDHETLFPAENVIVGHWGSPPVDISPINDLPAEFKLAQNYPNPFNPSTRIKFSIPVSGHISLKVFDLLGNEISILVNDYMIAGEHEVEFTAKDLPSGIYFYTLSAGNFTNAKKFLLLK